MCSCEYSRDIELLYFVNLNFADKNVSLDFSIFFTFIFIRIQCVLKLAIECHGAARNTNAVNAVDSADESITSTSVGTDLYPHMPTYVHTPRDIP